MSGEGNWAAVARSEQVTEDAPFGCAAGGRAIGLYRRAGVVTAIGDFCPHERNVRLSGGWLEGGVIECPMHQATFDIASGKCLGGPTDEDVPCYAVREEAGIIYVRID